MIGNIASLALGVVGSQSVQWERFLRRHTNNVGHKVPQYEPAKPLRGNVQPVPTARYAALGLDFAKRYVTLYTPAGVVAVSRDEAGDRIAYDGRTYVAIDETDWLAQAGWVAVLCVEVKA
jgi:hypothetical protein